VCAPPALLIGMRRVGMPGAFHALFILGEKS
jgi:hypothetical protein